MQGKPCFKAGAIILTLSRWQTQGPCKEHHMFIYLRMYHATYMRTMQSVQAGFWESQESPDYKALQSK
jgi:hypothetical protein